MTHTTQITAWAGLHCLPEGTVVRDADNRIAAKVADPRGISDAIDWYIAGIEGELDPLIPVAVLYMPGGDA